MPLTILVPMILIGLPLVIGLVYLIGNEKAEQNLSQDGMLMRFADDFPGVECQTALLDDTQTIALLSGDGQLKGLVVKIGQNYITRRVEDGLFKMIEADQNGVDVWLNDFTLKHIKLDISDADKRNQAIELFGH